VSGPSALVHGLTDEYKEYREYKGEGKDSREGGISPPVECDVAEWGKILRPTARPAIARPSKERGREDRGREEEGAGTSWAKVAAGRSVSAPSTPRGGLLSSAFGDGGGGVGVGGGVGASLGVGVGAVGASAVSPSGLGSTPPPHER
jgi:hypothetical protein